MSNKVKYTTHAKRNNDWHAAKRALSVNKVSYVMFFVLAISLCSPLAFVAANPGVHVSVPHSPLAPNQPVYIEFYTDPGEDGTIQMDITKPPLLAIFWQSGPMPISGGLLYDITAPGFSDPGTYVVSASVTLAGGGGTIYASTTFEVTGGSGPPGGPGGPGFDFILEVSPPMTEVEKGGTAHYQVHVIYSDPSYSGTMINVQLMGLGPGMQWHTEPGGQIVITTSPETPPGTYTMDVVGEAQGVVRQTTITLVVLEGPEEHPPEPPPEEHEPPPEEHEPPPEEHEPPPEEHEEQPEEYQPEPPPEEEYRWEEQPREPAPSFLENPLYIVIALLVVVIVIMLIVVLRRPTHRPPSTKYCSKCGKPLKPGDTFCSSCGERAS